jgi:hypothetical protein
MPAGLFCIAREASTRVFGPPGSAGCRFSAKAVPENFTLSSGCKDPQIHFCEQWIAHAVRHRAVTSAAAAGGRKGLIGAVDGSI